MERTSLEAGTRGSGRCQITNGGGVMIQRIFVKLKSGDGGCFMKLQVRWRGRRCDGLASGRTSMTRFGNCLGYHRNPPLESLHFVRKIEFLLDHFNRLSSGTADGFRCSIGKRGTAKLAAE